MELSDFSALAALVLSIIAIWQTRSAQKSQEGLTTREIQLVRHQLADYEKAERAEKEANVSARLYKVGKSDWKLRVFNKGPAEARNVDVEVCVPEGSMFSQEWIAQKLPIKVMEKGENVDITAFVHLGSAYKEEIILKWDDHSENGRRKAVEVTI